ncbi:sensor histidine kinase [candidate division KSB1 bacterium]|nr:sensor histidine kinase [candidate division KSB1 bacterium]
MKPDAHRYLNINALKKVLFVLFFCLILIDQTAARETKTKIDSINAIPHEQIVSNLRKSLEIFSGNSVQAQSIHYKYGEAKSLEQLGKIYYLRGEYDKSTECNLKAITYFEDLNSIADLAMLYGNFGYQLKRRNLNRAKQYMQSGILLAEKNKLKFALSGLYDNYGVLHEMSNNPDSARYFYHKALALKTELADTIGIPYSLNNLSGIYAICGDFQQALKYLRQSDKYRNKENGSYGRIENLVCYGDIYVRMGMLDSAITKYNRCLAISDISTKSYLVRYCFEQLANLYEKKHDFQHAYLTQQKYSAYKDSVLNIQTNTKIAELEIDYETEKKDRQIAEKNLEIRKKTNQIVSLVTIIVLLTTLSFFIYRNQRLKRERMRQELEFKNQLKQLELEKTLADEKVRISRELHDNIGSHLTFIISSLDNLCYTEKGGRVFDRLTNLAVFSRNTLSELRNTIWAMKQEGADLGQLILKLHELKLQISSGVGNFRIQIFNNANEPTSLSATYMLNLYRIVQEAMQNAIKHAHASIVEIKFYDTLNGFSMQITDDGIGFDASVSNCGNGLRNMKHRCEECGGEFTIESSPAGTVITCDFALK